MVDSKVSLLAYTDYSSAESDEQRTVAIKKHSISVRQHLNGLSAKRYQSLYGIKSLDFVVMFIPIESAFLLAIDNDRDLWREAWNKNVLMVGPSSLLFVLRTVAHLWRQESQSRNAQDIAMRGADLYDKFVGFVAELEDLGKKIDGAKSAYDDARKKLTSGRGNLVRQAEMLRDLGVKPSKTLPSKLLDEASDEGVGAS